MARAFGFGSTVAGRCAAAADVRAASRSAVDRRIIGVAPGSVRAAHGVKSAAAEEVGLAGEHEGGVVEKVDRLSDALETGDRADGADGAQSPAGARNEEIDLRVSPHGDQRAVAPNR